MRLSNSSLAMAAALMLVGFGGANATAQTFQAPTSQPPTDQAPGAKSDITRVQTGSDTSGVVSGQAKSDEPSMGAGSKQRAGARHTLHNPPQLARLVCCIPGPTEKFSSRDLSLGCHRTRASTLDA